jgi:hypothetical protein
MLDVKDIKNLDSEDLLMTYEGKNPYINYMRKKKETEKKYFLTNNQSNYVKNYFTFEPKVLNKVIELTNYFSEELQEEHKLKITPKKIFLETLLAESEKAIHVICKLYKNQKDVKLLWIPKTQILDDIHYEELEIDIDFDKYQKLDKRGWKAFKHQEDGIKFLMKKKKCILADDMGLGKAQCVNSEVFTPYGREKIGNIKSGDYVIGSDGKPTLVEAVYPQGVKDLYRVTFNDGYSTLCCKEHLWTVSSNNSGENSKNKENKYHTLSVEQMIDEKLELEQYGKGWNKKRSYKFKTYYKTNNGQNKWQIPIVKTIQFSNDDKLPIDPYLLGVIIGDDHISNSGYIRILLDGNDFDEIFTNQFINEGKEQNGNRINLINTIKKEITSLGLNGKLSYSKFIPDIYKYSSIEDRLSILQGLMDTDGHCMKSKNGNFTGTEYSTVSEKLADDVAEIVHSLGGIVRKKSRVGSYKKEDGTIVKGRINYRLNIKLPEGMNPFRLKRKSDEYNPPKKYKIGRYIKDIKLEKQGEAVCIQVAAEDHLYVTEHGIVTHNTYQSIVAALECNAERVLIICPSSLKINWMREVQNFCDDVSIITGSYWDPARFTIINYDILKNFHTVKEKNKEYEEWELRREIADFNPDLLILDEAHYVKNHKSNRGAILKDLSKNFSCERVWLLTGTPIANRPMDYYNLLSIIDSPITNNWVHYAKTYCEGMRFRKGGKYVWVTKGASNLDELSSKTKRTILRRKKEDVLDLPPKLITPVYLELQNVDEYKSVWENYLEKRRLEGKKGNPAKDLVEMTLLRTFIAMETVPYSIEKVEEALELNKKVIIFCNFNDEMDAFNRHFGNKAVCVRGGMSDKQKQLSVDRFQEDDSCKVFIGQIKAAGVGLTLTKAEIVIMNSLDWVPGNHEQAEDRCIFGGQWVLTENGYKVIEDINIGDFVYTHKGNFKPVIGKSSHLERKKLRYDINAFGYNDVLSVTEDHKLYVYDNKEDSFKWIEAKDINIRNHFLTIKSVKQPLERKKYLNVNSYVSNTFKNNFNVEQTNGRLVNLPEKVELTNDLLYAFGFFIAEGWTVISDIKSSTVNICQKITNSKMYDASEYIIKIIKESFGIEKHSTHVDTKNVKSCTIHSKELAYNFKDWFGGIVYEKQLPIWVDELNEEQLDSLLKGYYHGDGYRRKNTQQATTSSIKLISQLIRYNCNLGRPISLSNKGENNYSIEYSLDEVKNKRIKLLDGYITYPIKSINISKPKKSEERVYDLSVEDDNSFVVGIYNVHNCYRIGQKETVNIYYMLMYNTIDTLVWDILNEKKKIIGTIMGEDDIINEFINKIEDES